MGETDGEAGLSRAWAESDLDGVDEAFLEGTGVGGTPLPLDSGLGGWKIIC